MANLPVPIPRNFAVSEVESGATLNSLRDAVLFALNPPEAVLYQAAAQSIPNGAWTAVGQDSTTIDTYGGHSNSTNNSRYTAQVAGTVWVRGTAGFAANATGVRGGAIYKNGAEIEGHTQAVFAPTGGGYQTVQPVFDEVQLAVGDYVELFVYQSSGAALNTSSGWIGQRCGLSVLWFHA